MSQQNLLEIEDIAVAFGGVRAVQGFSLAMAAGERVAIIGPNGAGKSTLINLIAGVIAPDAGDIRFAGRSIRKVPAQGRARLGIARTFQNLELFLTMSVLENLLVALDSETRVSSPWLGTRHRLPRRQRALQTLKLFGIERYADMPTGALPYGVRKLVELSRVLVAKPRLVLLDEPVAGVDDARQFVSVLATALDQRDVTLLIIEHDMPTVRTLSNHVYVLDAGATIAHGTFAEIAVNPLVIEAYLGKAELP
jgi:ABC-type branched-subunit amino acid transport system ATPase component